MNRRGVVTRVFELFDRLGSARAVVKTLLTQQVCLGVRLPFGPNRGQIEWRPAALSTVAKMLHHPIYAGIYVFGRTQADPRRRGKDGKGPGRVAVEPDRYHAYLPGQCPGYITPEQYEANQHKLTANRSRTECRAQCVRVRHCWRDWSAVVGANAECRSPTPALEVAAENSVTPASTALPLRKDVVTSSSARHWTRRSRMRPCGRWLPGPWN